jgi:murein DD-endopeptidase MepM/ murein hydrolase activator NlpD
MQFMPSTWQSYAADGDFDGTKSVDNIFDAALAAGRYLVRAGAPADMDKAIFAYNHAQAYVDAVKAQATKYGATTVPSGGMPGVGSQAFAKPAEAAEATEAAKTSTNKWVRPVKGGALTARFGQAGGRWSSGFHTGLDFGVGSGTPVFAAQAGFVSVSHPSWAGNLITIDHGTLDGKKVQTRYAHLESVVKDAGLVKAGQLIAYSGALGNVSGPHLHFEVLVNGKFVNPEAFLAGAGSPIFIGGDLSTASECGDLYAFGDEDQNTMWGGYENGKIPVGVMCEVAANKGYLRCDAAHALNDLDKAYRKKFGAKMPIKVTYRSYEEQVACQASGSDCEPAGSSRYGYGMVVKFGKPLAVAGTPEHEWMAVRGTDTGWVDGGDVWEFAKKSDGAPPDPEVE